MQNIWEEPTDETEAVKRLRLQGKSYAEISDELGISKSIVRNRISYLLRTGEIEPSVYWNANSGKKKEVRNNANRRKIPRYLFR